MLIRAYQRGDVLASGLADDLSTLLLLAEEADRLQWQSLFAGLDTLQIIWEG